MEALAALEPASGDGIPDQLKSRFDQIADAPGRQGLLARVFCAQQLRYLDRIDPTWTHEKLLPLFSWSHAEAAPMWCAYANSRLGSPRLFNALKQNMFEAFSQPELSRSDLQSLTSNILTLGIWHQNGQGAQYNLSNAEIRRLLTITSGDARTNAAGILWRYVGDESAGPVNKADRWRDTIGPFFQNVWPLTAALRDENTSEYLTYMALECDAAFPAAVDVVLDFLVPYRLYSLTHSLRLEASHSALVAEYPQAFIKLLNAIVDPAVHPIPNDLATVLQECVAASPAIATDPAYTRLYGFRRMSNA
jgi:hypothetical protein